jgi:hypothetical protein
MTVAGGLEIRPGSVADLPALVAVFGQRRWFSDQLARQRAGGGVLLVAWLEDHPAGDVYLNAMKRGLLGGNLRIVTSGAPRGGPLPCCTQDWIYRATGWTCT